jgi:type VI secretion system protein ImpE
MAGPADALLRAGDITGARAAVADELKRDPSNTAVRQFFWQIAALSGDWERAETHLRTLGNLQSSAIMMAQVYGQAIRAERKRDAVFEGTRAPISLVGTEPWVAGLLDALHAATTGASDAEARRDAALDAAPETPGTWGAERFAWIADADERIGPMLELIVGEEHGFIPFAAIARITAAEPRDLKDAIWFPLDVALKSGQSTLGFLPVVYHGTPLDPGTLRLARATDWSAAGAGLGQRLFATDREEMGALDLRDVRFD